ncbi:hypothetical protein MLD38_021486 [Melastoma candidum]|uniref:Uncharacterized protein n=1 Tax=Melastoma candidum TaxID=119954 RepID=A0ACB9QGE6_9MYRT|nr:hypothetical protein MLD38_021486 [Melastoma candidum]
MIPSCAGNQESIVYSGEKYDIAEETALGLKWIFGATSAKKLEIEDLVRLLESQNPNPDPISNLDKVGGCWKPVSSTITILGPR